MAHTFFARFVDSLTTPAASTRRDDEPVVEIHGPLHHLTALYERMRTFIDYQEERFIRRLAIRRILFRQIIIEANQTNLGERLLRELIRSAYIENGRYPVRIAKDIDALLANYALALPVLERRYAPPELIRMQRRLLGLAAAEIEELLNPTGAESLLTDKLAGEIADYLDRPIDDEIRIIALRALWKADAELITASLLGSSQSDLNRRFHAKPADTVSDLLRLVIKIEYAARDRRIEAQIRRFARLVPPYIVLADLAEREPKKLAELEGNPDRLERALETLVQTRLEATEAKLHRAILRTTIYIFVTKIITGLAIEIPYDLAVEKKIIIPPLAMNLLVSPALMFAAGLGLHTPGPANTRILVDRARRILFDEPLPPVITVEAPTRRRPPLASVFFFAFYFATYLVSFGGLIWLLNLLAFNFASILVFLFFLCVVGFFAFRIRGTAKELAMIKERENFFFLIFDFFALPFLRVGRFLSSSFRQLNVALFVLDFIIEAPLKIVLVALEDWFAFLREKREELN